jgi:hypothetical protein
MVNICPACSRSVTRRGGAEQDEVRGDLVALVLEVVLCQPHRVVAEPVRRPGPVDEFVVPGDDGVVAVAAVGRYRRTRPDVGHGNAAVVVDVDPHDLRLREPRFAGVSARS